MKKFWRSSWWRTTWQSALILIATAAISCWPLYENVQYAPWPKSWSPLAKSILAFGFFAPLIWLALCGIFPVCIITLLFWQKARPLRRLAPTCLVAWITLASSIWHLLSSSAPAREAGLNRMVAQAKPLIAAIEAYGAKNGHYPRKLTELVPEYIAEIPYTGAVGYPEFRYETHWKEALFKTYELSVSTPTPGINFDQFVYWPERVYPADLYGGTIERHGDWVYVNE